MTIAQMIKHNVVESKKSYKTTFKLKRYELVQSRGFYELVKIVENTSKKGELYIDISNFTAIRLFGFKPDKELIASALEQIGFYCITDIYGKRLRDTFLKIYWEYPLKNEDTIENKWFMNSYPEFSENRIRKNEQKTQTCYKR